MKKKIFMIIVLLALICGASYFYMTKNNVTKTPQIVSKTKEKKQKKEENKAKEEIKKQIVKDDEQKPATVTKEKETNTQPSQSVKVFSIKDGTYSSSTHAGLEVGQITDMTLVGDQYITIKGSFVEMSADGEEVEERFDDASRTFVFDDQVKFYFYGEKDIEMKKADFFKDAKSAPGIDFTITNNKITKMAFYSQVHFCAYFFILIKFSLAFLYNKGG